MKTTLPPSEQFFLHVDRPSPYSCWEWTGSKNSGGYGNIGIAFYGHNVAHRYAYELLVRPIPDGLQLDHLCRNRCCVNPDHLEPVTNQENARRGLTGKATGAKARAKTHCPYGHPYDATNTHHTRAGTRSCKTCAGRPWRALRRAQKAAQ